MKGILSFCFTMLFAVLTVSAYSPPVGAETEVVTVQADAPDALQADACTFIYDYSVPLLNASPAVMGIVTAQYVSADAVTVDAFVTPFNIQSGLKYFGNYPKELVATAIWHGDNQITTAPVVPLIFYSENRREVTHPLIC